MRCLPSDPRGALSDIKQDSPDLWNSDVHRREQTTPEINLKRGYILDSTGLSSLEMRANWSQNSHWCTRRLGFQRRKHLRYSKRVLNICGLQCTGAIHSNHGRCKTKCERAMTVNGPSKGRSYEMLPCILVTHSLEEALVSAIVCLPTCRRTVSQGSDSRCFPHIKGP